MFAKDVQFGSTVPKINLSVANMVGSYVLWMYKKKLPGDLYRTEVKCDSQTPLRGLCGVVTSPCRTTSGGEGGKLILTGMAHNLGPPDQTNGLPTTNKGRTLLLHMLGDFCLGPK